MFEVVDYIVALFHNSVMEGCMDRTSHNSGFVLYMVQMNAVLVYRVHMLVLDYMEAV